MINTSRYKIKNKTNIIEPKLYDIAIKNLEYSLILTNQPPWLYDVAVTNLKNVWNPIFELAKDIDIELNFSSKSPISCSRYVWLLYPTYTTGYIFNQIDNDYIISEFEKFFIGAKKIDVKVICFYNMLLPLQIVNSMTLTHIEMSTTYWVFYI